jgi:hypothetical protein
MCPGIFFPFHTLPGSCSNTHIVNPELEKFSRTNQTFPIQSGMKMNEEEEEE